MHSRSAVENRTRTIDMRREKRNKSCGKGFSPNVLGAALGPRGMARGRGMSVVGPLERSDQLRPALAALERSKYSLRIILLLYAKGTATLSWLVRHVETSPNTVVRCVRQLESAGVIEGRWDTEGQRRHTYRLTPAGRALATSPPIRWPGLITESVVLA